MMESMESMEPIFWTKAEKNNDWILTDATKFSNASGDYRPFRSLPVVDRIRSNVQLRGRAEGGVGGGEFGRFVTPIVLV